MSDTLTVYLSGNASAGDDAEAVVSINGVQVSGTLDVSAVNASDNMQAFTFTGNYGPTPQVSISFINEAYVGTQTAERDLFVDGFAYNGVPQLGLKSKLNYDETFTYPLTSTVPTAERAADFLNSLGVNVHLSYNDTSYANSTLVAASLAYLGVTNVRDGLPTSQTLPEMEALAASGIKFDIIMPETSSDTLLPTQLAALDAIAPDLTAIEGPNEVNLNSNFSWDGQTGDAAEAAYQEALSAAVKADPDLSSVPVDALTLGGVGSAAYQALGNLSADATDGNMHVYFANGAPPEATLQYVLGLADIETPDLPVVITETNYSTAPAISGSVSDTVQASYDLDLLMDATKAGVAETYFYELLDEQADPAQTNVQNHYGLFNADGTPKPAATAIHNLTDILADNGSDASFFSTGSLTYTLAGLPASGDTLLLQKSNGVFDLIVWAEPKIWNATTGTAVAAPLSQVEIALGSPAAAVTVFDPLLGTTIAEYDDVSDIPVTITDHPLVIEITPDVPCYRVGTNILGPSGEVAIEDLRKGDLVITSNHGRRQAQPVKWLGYREVDCRRHSKPSNVWPIRVCASAFASGKPHRDLWLSPDHCVFVSGVLIPIRCLINDRSIIQEAVERVTYCHLELERHDVVLAEGLPAETFLDTGNRSDFTNGGPRIQEHPDFAGWMRESDACAPLVITGKKLDHVRISLLKRIPGLATKHERICVPKSDLSARNQVLHQAI